jgi:hypothetical protein
LRAHSDIKFHHSKSQYLTVLLFMCGSNWLSEMRLRWSGGCVLAPSTQVRGLKPGRSRRVFSGRKNSQHAFLRRGSKAGGPMS